MALDTAWVAARTVASVVPATLFPGVAKKQNGDLILVSPRMSTHLTGDGDCWAMTGADNGNGTITWRNDWTQIWQPARGYAVRMYEPTSAGWSASVATPLLLAFHSAGNDRTSPFGAVGDSVITAARAAGYLVAATDTNGSRLWGNAREVAAYAQGCYEYALWNYNISRTILWAASMGGLAALTLAHQAGPHRELLKGACLHYPVCSLANAYTGPYSSEIATAYGGNPATKGVGQDPYQAIASKFAGLRFKFFHSAGDTIIPKAQHTDLMAAKLAPVAASVDVVTTSGDHGDASNWDWNTIGAFLATCV